MVSSVIDLWLGNAALQWQLTRITFFPADELEEWSRNRLWYSGSQNRINPKKYSNTFSPSYSNQLHAEKISQWWNTPFLIFKSHSSQLFSSTIPSENQELLSVCQCKPILWKSVPFRRSSTRKCQVVSWRNKDRCFVTLAPKTNLSWWSIKPQVSAALCALVSSSQGSRTDWSTGYLWFLASEIKVSTSESNKTKVSFGCWKCRNRTATFNLVKALYSAGFLVTQMSNYSPSPAELHVFRVFDSVVHTEWCWPHCDIDFLPGWLSYCLGWQGPDAIKYNYIMCSLYKNVIWNTFPFFDDMMKSSTAFSITTTEQYLPGFWINSSHETTTPCANIRTKQSAQTKHTNDK